MYSHTSNVSALPLAANRINISIWPEACCATYALSIHFHLVMVRWEVQKEAALWTAPYIYFACAIENNVSCKSLEKLILFFSAKVFSHAGIVRFFLTAFSPYFSS